MENRDFKIISSKHRFMTISDIHKNFGSRGVVAFSCKVEGDMFKGGYVAAISDVENGEDKNIKIFLKKFRNRFPEKDPTYYLRLKIAENSKYIEIYYDDGHGERKSIPTIEEVKPSEIEQAVNSIPSDILAQAIMSSFKSGK